MESLEFSGSSTVHVESLSPLFEKHMGKICIYVYTFAFINISLSPNTAEIAVVRMLIPKRRAVLAKNVVSGYKCFCWTFFFPAWVYKPVKFSQKLCQTLNFSPYSSVLTAFFQQCWLLLKAERQKNCLPYWVLLVLLWHKSTIKAGIGGVCPETMHLDLDCLVPVSVVELSQGHCGESHREAGNMAKWIKTIDIMEGRHKSCPRLLFHISVTPFVWHCSLNCQERSFLSSLLYGHGCHRATLSFG